MNYEKLSLLQALKRWPRITMYSISLSLNILLWGYDSAIVGNVSSMPVFMSVTVQLPQTSLFLLTPQQEGFWSSKPRLRRR